MRINEASCVPILETLGNVIVNWDTKKNIKNGDFLFESLWVRLKLKNH